jgi:hypothetical protein
VLVAVWRNGLPLVKQNHLIARNSLVLPPGQQYMSVVRCAPPSLSVFVSALSDLLHFCFFNMSLGFATDSSGPQLLLLLQIRTQPHLGCYLAAATAAALQCLQESSDSPCAGKAETEKPCPEWRWGRLLPHSNPSACSPFKTASCNCYSDYRPLSSCRTGSTGVR